MQMTIRWFGADKDTVTLSQIKQIPGVTGVVPALHRSSQVHSKTI